MKKYTCKLVPKNGSEEIREFDIEINQIEKKPEVWKLVTAGIIAAFCFGMIIALFAWCAIVNHWEVHGLQFYIMLYSITALTSLTIICGLILIIFLFKAPKNNDIETRVIEKVIDTVAQEESKEEICEKEGKKKKGFQINVVKF